MIDSGELGVWFRLIETPRLGRDSARKLLAAFGSPDAAIAATTAARREVVGPQQAAALAEPADTLDAPIQATIAWLADDAAAARDVIPLGDPRYPAALFEAPDPPLLLYVHGRAELLQAQAIAIVGSRSPTPQGANAQAFASHLSHGGLTVISGLAVGIDAAAHAGALEGAASTIAVVGTGLDQIYPKRNQRLAQLCHLALRPPMESTT